MISVTLYTPQGEMFRGSEELLSREGIRWIDIQAPDADVLNRLKPLFSLHRLAIEDCLHLGQRPKLEEYPGHHFVVLQAFTCANDSVLDLTLHEQHFFLGPDWLISVHELPAQSFHEVMQRVEDSPAETIGRGADFLLYLLSDALVDLNFPVVEQFNEEMEELELNIFNKPQQSQLEKAFLLKRALVKIRRILAPQREVIERLARRGVTQVSERSSLYFRDVDDHLLRLHEQIDSARDLISNTIEGYMSVVANRTSEITKQLTLFASIFLPLSFLTGFFGQNFSVLSADHFLWGVVALSVLLPVGLLAWFRSREWI